MKTGQAGPATFVLMAVVGFLAADAARAADVQSSWIKSSTAFPEDKVQNEQGSPGWHMNLGPTGIRARLVDQNGECKDGAEGTCFDVKYVFPDSPADKKILPGDRIVGVNGKTFSTVYGIGYWAGVGYEGPPMEFGEALEASEAGKKGKLEIMVVRAGTPLSVTVQIQGKGAFSATYPFRCKKSQKLVKEGCEYLAKLQGANGRWPGGDDANVTVALALLAQGKTYYPTVKRFLDVSLPGVTEQTWNWQLSLYSILSSEYLMASGDLSYVPHMQRFNDLFRQNQFPNHLYGHMGFAVRDRGCYGTMFACSSLACVGWAMLERAGIPVHTQALDQSMEQMDMAYAKGSYGYGFPLDALPTPYNPDAVTNGFHYIGTDVKTVEPKSRGGIFPTSAMALAQYLHPYRPYSAREMNEHLTAIARRRPGIPNGHGSGALHLCWNMVASACGSAIGRDDAFRAVMDYLQGFLNLSRCHDGTFYLQPQRDPSTYDYSHVPRSYATALWCLVLSAPDRNLVILGKKPPPVSKALKALAAATADAARPSGASPVPLDAAGTNPVVSLAGTPFADAVAVWHLADASDATGKSGPLTVRGPVTRGADLSGPERDESLRRGGDGRTAEFGGGWLILGKDAAEGLNVTGRAVTVCMRLRNPSGRWTSTGLLSKKVPEPKNYNLYAHDFGHGTEFGFELDLSGPSRFRQIRAPLSGLAPDGWHDLVARYDGAKLELFVDGVLRDRRTAGGDIAEARSADFMIGADPGGQNMFRGLIDHAAVWNRALADAEIEFLSGGRQAVEKARAVADKADAGIAKIVAVPTSYANVPWWKQRHEEKLAQVKQGGWRVVFIGDSITHGWEGGGKEVWDKVYAPRQALNLGFGGDSTLSALWRLMNGEFDGLKPEVAIVMIGTNNTGMKDSPRNIFFGVRAIVDLIRSKSPKTKILLLAIFPRSATPNDGLRLNNEDANRLISTLDDNRHVFYLDINKAFLQPDGTLTPQVMPDALHPSPHGYALWSEAMEPTLKKLLGE